MNVDQMKQMMMIFRIIHESSYFATILFLFADGILAFQLGLLLPLLRKAGEKIRRSCSAYVKKKYSRKEKKNLTGHSYPA